jgi:ureidoglycolate hydrolase
MNMSEAMNHRIKVLSTDDPLFQTVARMVKPPQFTAEKTYFEAAYASFDIAQGTEVDLSFFYEPPSDNPWADPRRTFDRHLRTEELWVCMEGDFYLPVAVCANPDDPEELPKPEEMICFEVRQGDVFVLKPNVWHTGPWAMQKGQSFSFYMALSGHRKSQDGDLVDHILKDFPNHAGILPDVDETGRPR